MPKYNENDTTYTNSNSIPIPEVVLKDFGFSPEPLPSRAVPMTELSQLMMTFSDTSVPTHTPKNFYQQFIRKGNRVYVHDPINQSWQRLI